MPADLCGASQCLPESNVTVRDARGEAHALLLLHARSDCSTLHGQARRAANVMCSHAGARMGWASLLMSCASLSCGSWWRIRRCPRQHATSLCWSTTQVPASLAAGVGSCSVALRLRSLLESVGCVIVTALCCSMPHEPGSCEPTACCFLLVASRGVMVVLGFEMVWQIVLQQEVMYTVAGGMT